MNTETNTDAFIKVKDSDGIDLVCPARAAEDVNRADEENWDDCFEADVIGRYAGRIKIVDPAA